MQYVTLGQHGLRISRLTMGAMTFGSGESVPGFYHTVGQAAANELVARAIDAGVNCFDTANLYAGGQSEEILGRAVAGRRHEVLLATKVGGRMPEANIEGGLSYHHVIESAEASLRRLGTDYIDLFQIHVPDPRTPFEETARALDELVRRGLVRYIGFCNLSGQEAAADLAIQREHNYASFVSAQMYYSLVGREIEQDIVPLAEETGLAILVWGPLAGGFLSGKYTRDNPDGGGGRRATFRYPPVNLPRDYDVIDTLKEIAARHAATPAQIALAWLLAKSPMISVILGISKLQQLEDNLAAINLTLTADDMSELDAVSAPAA